MVVTVVTAIHQHLAAFKAEVSTSDSVKIFDHVKIHFTEQQTSIFFTFFAK